MKRSEVVLKLARWYTMKNCMVEQGYMSKLEFADGILEIVEAMGMLPPDRSSSYFFVPEVSRNPEYKWDKE